MENSPLAHLATFEQLARLAPLTVIVISILLVGVGISWFFVKNHISDLKSFIEYLKDGK